MNHRLRRWLRTNLPLSETLVFILVLASSYGFVRIAVVGVLMDYLSDRFENNLRKAAAVENVRDGLSSIVVVVTHLAESYAGCFNVIVLWTAVNVIGLMLLWISSETSLHNGIFYVGLILIALGDSMDSTLEDFLEYQLEEKKEPSADTTTNSTSSNREEEENEVNRGWIWWKGALLVGSLMAWMLGDTGRDWTKKFKIAAVVMGAAYFWFYFGCFSYDYEEPCGSPQYKVCRDFMAASARKLPDSEDGYYAKNPNTPDVPIPSRRLDKAALKDPSKLELQETKGKPFSVEEVSEMKFASLINFSMTLLPYSLMKAAASTFFIEQMSKLEDSENISLLLLLKFCFRELMVAVFWLFKLNRERKYTIYRIRAGMLSSVACCIVACGVEMYRLSTPSATTIYIMIPQFLLLGAAEGLAFKGFETFFCYNVPKSMWSLKEVYTEFLLGLGKLLSVPFVIFITGWFKDSINKSSVYWYYLTLAFLNLAAFTVFSYFSGNYVKKEGGTTEMQHMSEQSDGEDQAATPRTWPMATPRTGPTLRSKTMPGLRSRTMPSLRSRTMVKSN